MDWVLFQTVQRYNLSPSQQPFFVSQSLPSLPPPSSPSLQSGFDIGNKISPSILLIIIILAVIFFVSGLLHLLVRFLFKPIIRDPEDTDNVTALQGQLQQLFNLHDSGVDQSYIDTLPVFLYNAIKGIKNPFDCAVCLCEFEADDKLRLLPKCSHAFHLECIDTWLLSHSSCPLCRGSLTPDFSTNSSFSPVVFVLDSGGESSREIISDRDGVTSVLTSTNPVAGRMGFHGEDELGSSCNNVCQKFCEVPIKDEVTPVMGSTEKVVSVKLGKFRNVDSVAVGNGEGSSNQHYQNSSNGNIDGRRCFSMGSFEYVLDESSSLEVAIRPPTRKQSNKKLTMPLTPGHRIAMSECDGHSVREGFEGFCAMKKPEVFDVKNSIRNSIERSKKESFSFSKIWLRTKKDKPLNNEGSSRRAFSFRFALPQSSGADDLKTKHNSCSGRTTSEVDLGRWDNCVSELDYDEEVGSCKSLDSQSNLPSFARRTLQWLYGRPNKVVHSSPNV